MRKHTAPNTGYYKRPFGAEGQHKIILLWQLTH